MKRFFGILWSFLEPVWIKIRMRPWPILAAAREMNRRQVAFALAFTIFAAIMALLSGCGLRTNIILPPRTQYQSCSDVLFGITSMCHSSVFASDQPVAIGGARGVVYGGTVGVPQSVQPGSDYYDLCVRGRATLQPQCYYNPPGQPGSGQYPGPRFAPDEWSDPFFGESLELDGVLHVPLE